MKNLKIFAIIFLCIGLLFSASSCAVFVKPAKDQGRHVGWYNKPYQTRSSIRVNQGTQKGWFKKSFAPNSRGKANQGINKGNSKKKYSR